MMIFFRRQRQVEIIIVALAVARRAKGHAHVYRFRSDDGRNRIVKIEMFGPKQGCKMVRKRRRSERSRGQDHNARGNFAYLSSNDPDTRQRLDGLSQLTRKQLTIHRQGGPRWHSIVFGHSNDERIQPSHFLFEHARRCGYQTGAQRIAAHQLAEIARGMGLGHSVRPHLVQVDTHASARELASRFRACQSAADYADDFFHYLLGDLDRIAALFFATTADAPGSLGNLLHKNRIVTVRARARHGASPRSEFALWIAVASVKNFSSPRLALYQIAFFAFGTFDAEVHRLLERPDVSTFGVTTAAEKLTIFPPAQLHRPAALFASLIDFFFLGDVEFTFVIALKILGVFAFGIARAGQELAVSAPLHHHHGPALFTGNIGRHFLAFDVTHFLRGLFEIPREGSIEPLHRFRPRLFPLFDLVQLIFHPGGELHVQNIRETLHQKIRDQKSELCRRQRPSFVLDHVLTIQNVGNDRRVGRRTADAFFIQFLDQRSLGVTGRRLGEVLPRIHGKKL